LTELSTLYLYVGQDGASNSFAGGAATIVSTTNLHDIATDAIQKPKEVGILVIAGGGGSGGGAGDVCAAGAEIIIRYCNDGHDGFNGGSASLSTTSNRSAAGGGITHDTRQGGGGNVDGMGTGGTGANRADRDGSDGIGGLGGLDRFSHHSDGSSVQSGFVNSPLTSWSFGQGGSSQGVRGDASGGGGFGGGGSSGGTDEQHKGGSGGGGSWARQATANPELRGKSASSIVVITFSIESLDND